jgi:RNA polymerase sigma-70 factor (ECF subfamily)
MPFQTTMWTVVYEARGPNSTEARQALETLCAIYWRPLFQFARRRGLSNEDAQEMTQEFFTQLLERNAFEHLDRTKGKFRSFLLTSFTNMLNNEWDRARAKKRDPGKPLVSLSVVPEDLVGDSGETFSGTPELLFDREWALTILSQAMTIVESQFADAGKSEALEKLKPYLTASTSPMPYAELADELGLTVGGVKSAVHRLRKQYREAIRETVRNTVHSPDEIDDEIRYLLRVLSHEDGSDNADA